MVLPRSRNVCYFYASAAGASEENFSDFGDVHLGNSVHLPPSGKLGGCTTPSNDLRGYDTPSDQTRGSRPTTSDTSRGQNPHPSDPPPPSPGGLCVTLLTRTRHATHICIRVYIYTPFTCNHTSVHLHARRTHLRTHELASPHTHAPQIQHLHTRVNTRAHAQTCGSAPTRTPYVRAHGLLRMSNYTHVPRMYI